MNEISTKDNAVPVLADLAERINAEHKQASVAIKKGLEHALRAGELLLEAKAALKHGEWLPWLKQNCAFSERTAQLYMRVHRKREALAENETVADLGLKDAANLLVERFTDNKADGWSPEGPFTIWDLRLMDEDNEGWPLGMTPWFWFNAKAMKQMELPPHVITAMNIEHLHKVPALRTCPSDDLVKALDIAATYVKRGPGQFELDVPNASADETLELWTRLTMTAQGIVARLWHELFNERKKFKTVEAWHENATTVANKIKTSVEAMQAEWAAIQEARAQA